MLEKEVTQFTRDIEHIRWLSEQHLEKSRNLQSPKVLVSNWNAIKVHYLFWLMCLPWLHIARFTCFVWAPMWWHCFTVWKHQHRLLLFSYGHIILRHLQICYMLYETYSYYKYLDYITWWMYIWSHFGRSYCVFQILIQMTVRPRIINTPCCIFMVHTIKVGGCYHMWLLYYLES